MQCAKTTIGIRKMNKFASTVIAFFVLLLPLQKSACASESKSYGNLKVKTLISVYDGDTFKVNLSRFHPIMGEIMSIRIAGIDTPEIRGSKEHIKKLAQKAKARTEAILQGADLIELKNIRRGKYFRIIADVYADGKNLGDLLISEGLAKPYDGGKRPSWN